MEATAEMLTLHLCELVEGNIELLVLLLRGQCLVIIFQGVRAAGNGAAKGNCAANLNEL